MRVCEKRSDELKRRVYWIFKYMLDTSICNGGAAKFFAISNVTDALPLRLTSLVAASQLAFKSPPSASAAKRSV